MSLHLKKCKRKWDLKQKSKPDNVPKQPCPQQPDDFEEILAMAKTMEMNAIENPFDYDDDYESEMKLTEYNERILQSFEVPEVVRQSLSKVEQEESPQ